MSFFAKAFEKFDRAMGIENAPCRVDDPQAVALVNAGFSLLDSQTEINAETKLSEIATSQDLLKALKNLDSVYLRATEFSLGNDIINDVSVGEMITHLDATKVNTLIDTMVESEKRAASVLMHVELSDLENQINKV
ncbi:hypothetical protein GW756_01120 [bacterium]|nr:hypothetical protein [bacterium]NCQ54957.1 hypothetical protein [Candidatus Parcubacteria bacterium]NCS67001.1 hypothetical protein [Candidatus Peregrinibacteria bacterium]NCS95947.1 hypothetical protein [bacterium]